jgi:hypothetical protein
MSDGIWYPSKNHRGGECDVDRAWFGEAVALQIEKKYPQQSPNEKTMHLPEDIHFETETAYHHYIFKGGVPFHGVISKQIMKELTGTLILHRRKVEP